MAPETWRKAKLPHRNSPPSGEEAPPPEQRIDGGGHKAGHAGGRIETGSLERDVRRARPCGTAVEDHQGDHAGDHACPVAGGRTIATGEGGTEGSELERRPGASGKRCAIEPPLKVRRGQAGRFDAQGDRGALRRRDRGRRLGGEHRRFVHRAAGVAGQAIMGCEPVAPSRLPRTCSRPWMSKTSSRATAAGAGSVQDGSSAPVSRYRRMPPVVRPTTILPSAWTASGRWAPAPS